MSVFWVTYGVTDEVSLRSERFAEGAFEEAASLGVTGVREVLVEASVGITGRPLLGLLRSIGMAV